MKFLRGVLLAVLLALLLTAREPHTTAPVISGTLDPEFDSKPLPDRNFVFYTVKPGDSLNSIQMKFRILSKEEITALNPDLDPERLKVDDRIKLPL